MTMTDDGLIKTMMVTRRVLRQKEVTISMADGRYAKNEIIRKYTFYVFGEILEDFEIGLIKEKPIKVKVTA